ncbi:TerC family protein [Azospirillum soli]|uniref:TerC family protein n=1 Tax=Azospirillum soli TaxID=1304799 RepID=UPI001AEABE0E|nr:TerC family protein [Azospirillum soli]MBP2310924.1 tellurite resistance protein TerC [Azospirillum soli]
METSIWIWVAFNAFVVLLLALDLGVFHRRPHQITVREALIASAGYISLALVFNAGVYWFMGAQKGLEFTTGYLIEWSLSLDNIFVIAMIFGHFAVPPQHQHRVLFWGILGALVMRATLIFAGTALIHQFHWTIYLFGAFLLFTGVKMLMASEAEPDVGNNRLLRFVRSHVRMTDQYEGSAFFVRRAGVLMATPMLLVLVMVEATDLMFALDSVPAIFAVTSDPFIVYTSNVFAILGLRSLYFALAGIIHRFAYLRYGLSLVLVFIGTKMILIDVWKVPTALALGVTAGLIGGSVVLSLIKTRSKPAPAELAVEKATSEQVGQEAAAD